MRKNLYKLLLLVFLSCTPKPRFTDYYREKTPSRDYYVGMSWECIASYYGKEFGGRKTSSGETFDEKGITAAHPYLPFGTILEVVNLENGKRCQVRINDRGPFIAGRELDLSMGSAHKLGMIAQGTARVRVTIIQLGE